jgi:hypothetical protein
VGSEKEFGSTPFPRSWVGTWIREEFGGKSWALK